MIVASLDSGIDRTGYALLQKSSGTPELVTCGCIQTSKHDTLTTRIGQLTRELDTILVSNRPNLVVIEQLFFGINKKTAIAVAQSQGAALAVIAKHGLPVDFMGPSEMKQILTGYGKADKLQVKKMVGLLLPKIKTPKLDDVSDAIALGLAYLQVARFRALSEKML